MGKALLDEMTKAAQVAMISTGVEKNSKLIKTLEYKAVNEAFVLIANDYYQYLSTGRKPKVRKVPIKFLIKFIKDQRIRPRAGQTINSLAFAIQTSIYKSGIRGHKYIKKVETVSLDVAEEGVADIMEEAVVDAMADAFKI